MKKVICFIFVLFAVKTFSQEIILPDQAFTIKVTETNANGSVNSMPPDELILKANRINTKFSIKNGFAIVAYSVVQQGAPNTHLLDFTAESTNSNKDILKWTGTINGNSVEGKAQRIRKGKPAGEYNFTGTLKKKK